MKRESIWQAIWRINQKIPAILAVLVVLNVIVYALLAVFVEPKAEGLERRYINQQSEVRKAEQGGRSVESSLVVYARGTRDLQTFREAIPDKNELTGLISEIFTLAESSGLNISKISYRPEHLPEMQLLSYALDFNVVGDYDQIKKFTHKIEQSSRLLIINQMSLNSDKQGGVINLKLKLATFFRADAT